MPITEAEYIANNKDRFFKYMKLVVACSLIDIDGRILLAKRPDSAQMGGLWEFPGGKIEPDETPETASIVPIAFPLIAGAGTLTTLLSLRAEFQLINIIVAIIVNILFVRMQ